MSKVTLRKQWFDDIKNDPNFDITEQELAYIIYAAAMYGFTGEKVNIGEVFGREFRGLNFTMPNIYGQIDNIQQYDPSKGKVVKYDSNAIYELKVQNEKMTAREICKALGYPEDKARSLTSNEGWKRAQKEILQKKSENTDTDQSNQSVLSVQIDSELTQKSTDSVQKKSESTENMQKSVRHAEVFNF